MRIRALLPTLLFTLFAAEAAQAASITWSGSGATNNWNEGANWQGGIAPSVGDTAAFGILSSKACTLNVNVSIASVDMSAAYAGTLTALSTAAISLTGDFLQNGGSVNLQGSSVTVAGNWIRGAGLFNAGTSTVTFNGTGAGQTVDVQGRAFSTLIDSNTSSGGLIFSSSFTAANFRAQGLSAAATIYFNANSTYTITNLTVLGSPGKLISMRSTTAGTWTYLNNITTNTVAFVNAQDSNAGSGQTIQAGATSIDSGNNIHWNFSGLLAPVSPEITSVSVSSLTATWGSVGSSNGYSLEAYTDPGYTALAGSSVTSNGNATSLSLIPGTLLPNTTYYVRVGALWGGTTNYVTAVPASTSTLASLITNAQLYFVGSTSVTVNWAAMGTGSGINTAEGYELDASSTNFNGTGVVYVSSNATPAVSTLTVTGLTPGVGYALRVGGINWNGVPNFTSVANPSPLTAWVADRNGYVWPIYNLATTPTLGTAVTGIPVNGPYGVAITPDGNTAWVADNIGAKAWPVNNLRTTPTLGTAITGFTANGPWSVTITPDGTTAWVADQSLGKAWPINNLKTTPALGTAVSGMTVGGPYGIAITPDGNSAWVADYSGGKAWPINNLKSAPTLGTAVGGMTATGPTSIAITPDGTTAWVSDSNGRAWPINNLQTTPALGTAVTGMGANGPYGIAITPDGTTAWVADYNGKAWPIINLKTTPTLGTAVSGMSLSNGPYRIAITPDGTTAWVADWGGGKAWPINNLKTAPTLGTAVIGMGTGGPEGIAITGQTSIMTLSGTGPAPTNPVITSVSTSSLTATWGSVGSSSGYSLEASSTNFTGGVTLSSVTANGNATTLAFNPGQLMPNSTAYVRVGALWGGTTTYAAAVPASTSTLASLITNAQILQVTSSSITVGWTAFGVGPGPNTAEGYSLLASSTNFDGTGSLFISSTTNVALSTLAISGLLPSTTYFIQVGALNWVMNPNFTSIGSTRTAVTSTPTGLAGSPLGVSSITWTWNSVGGASSYSLYMATSPATLIAGGIVISTYTEIGLSTNTSYGRVVSAVVSGSTSSLSTGATTFTLAATPGVPNFTNILSSSFTVSWSSNTNPAGTPYEVSLSTNNFISNISTPVPFGMNFTGNTTSFIGLVPSTTYYVRIRAQNGNVIPTAFSMPGSTQTLAGSGLSVPSGFIGVATTPTSIVWTWALSAGATQYNLYLATSPATIIASTPSLTWSEMGLQPNVPYGLMVQAVGGGQLSPLSPSATTYTFANLPTVPSITNIGSSSFTVTWSTSNNPGYTPYLVELSPNNAFGVGTSTPVPFSANLTANTTNIIGLAPNMQYYIRVTAKNVDGFLTAPGPSTNATTRQNGITSGGGTGSGVGSAWLSPGGVPEGGVMTSTLTYSVPTGGMSAGGRLDITIPSGWWPNMLQNYNPGQDGFVTVTSTAAIAFAMSFSATSGEITLSPSSALSAGTQILVAFNNIHPNCPAPNQPSIYWEVKSAMSPSDNLADIAAQPSQTFTSGPAQWVGYNPPNPLTVVSGHVSQPVILQVNDNCGLPVAVSAPLTITLQGILSDWMTADSLAGFSTASDFSVSVTSVTIPTAASTTTYYYRTTDPGGSVEIQGNYRSPAGGYNQQVWRQINVLNSVLSFSNVSVDNGALVVGQKAMTLSPDGSGINNFAYIRFTPSDNTTQWHVTISSNGFQSFVFERWGNGDPLGTLSWDGRTYNTAVAGTAASGSQIVPNGTYAVKVEVGGLVSDTSLSIVVNSAQITGIVTVGGSPVAGAQVSAQGTNTPGYNSVQTDSNGSYTLNGLRAGYQYNLYATYISTVNQSVVTGQLNNVTAPASGQTFTLTTPAVLRVSAVLSSSSPVTVYGSINVHSADYTQNFWGNLRLLAGATTSDNGDSFNPSSWTVLYVQPGVSYVIQPNIPGFGTTPFSVVASSDVVISLVQKANIYGWIILPSSATVPSWISVEGVLNGNSYPTVWGGASFNVGQSSGIYAIYSVDPGAYTFRARPSGYVPAALTQTVYGTDIGDSINGGLNFSSSSFSTGGQISGLVTVNGDTSGMITPLPLWVNAYSPSLGLNVNTQVQLATNTVSAFAGYQIQGIPDGFYQIYPPYLQGFELAPGPQSVTVSGGLGQLNIILNQVTGRVVGTVKLPQGQNDYTSVHLTLQGPYSREVDLPSGPTYSLPNLGTGNYQLTAIYTTSGAQTQTYFVLANGQTQTINLDLSAPTYSVSGNVSVQNAFSMRNSSNSLVLINTLTDLLNNATTQTLILGGSPQNNGAAGTAAGTGFQCIGGTPTVVSTVRVEAFPKNFNSYGNANRNSFNNCFDVGQYQYGVVDSSGNYSISGLTPGIWEVDVYPYFDNGQTPDAAVSQQTISVVSGPVMNINFPLSNGYTVSGTLNLPAGITDTRSFNAQVLSSRGDLVQSASIMVTGANSVSYQFTGLPSASYALLVQDPGSYDQVLQQNVIKYVAKPVQFTILGADLPGVNVSMSRSSSIVGKLLIQGANPDGTPALTLITPNNENLLPNSFQISAQANPWVAGGQAQAQWGTSGGILIDSNNQFHINGMVAGTYDVTFQQNTGGSSMQSAGGLNLTALTKGSIQVAESQTVDLGTISLQPGLTLSGTVTDTSGNLLANIPVEADPPNNTNGNGSIRVFTDAQGNFSLVGLDPSIKIYTITAAKRPSPGDTSSRPVPYGAMVKLAVDVTQVPPPALNFALPPANGQLTGKIVTVDGGSLGYPESDQAGFPEAAIYTLLEGTIDQDNPLGDSNASALDGSFVISDLPAGTYDITVESLGYRPLKLTGIALTSTSKDLGTLTLQKGPSLKVTLAKPDGTSVNTSDVQFAVAATPDLGSLIFGQIASDANTGNITSIQFSGFELSPQTYSVLLFDSQSNITSPPEGLNLTFTSNSDSLVKALTYQPSQPFAFTHILKSGSSMLITYYFSRPIRNRGDDQDPTQWFTASAHPERLSNPLISADRRQLTVTYNPVVGEQNATVQFSAHTIDVDPSTGVEFVLSKTVTLLLGQKATAEANISPIFGGKISLSDNSDPSNVSIPSNALLSSSGTQLSASASYSVTFTATDDAGSIPGRALHGSVAAPSIQSLLARGSAAYVSEAYLAMQAMVKNQALQPHDSGTVSPFSSFYSVLLPAGISHTLNQNASLSLNYNTDADPTQINVYFFNGTEYLIENKNRTIDPVNHTISVSVSHFSTFVVLQNNLPVILVNGDNASGGDIDVFNFPNPFDLQTKTKTLNHGGTTSSLTTDGTIIRYVVPSTMVGPAHIDVYDVVGEKVRSIDLGTPSGGVYNYVDWDGRNSSGNKVASGVYVGVLKVGGAKKFWKMAVIK